MFETKWAADKGDGFGHFRHQQSLFYISVEHQHAQDVININILSPTSKNRHQYHNCRNFYLLKWVWPWYSWFSFERWSPPIPINCIWTSGCISVQSDFVKTGRTFGYILITSSSWHTGNWRSTIWTLWLVKIFKLVLWPMRSDSRGPWITNQKAGINLKKTWGNPLLGVSLSRPTRFENDEFDPNRANASIFGTSGSPRLLWDTDRSKILKIWVTKF